jgi:cytochrome c oxidase cbb3-type subunit 3
MGGIGPAVLNPDFLSSVSPGFLRMTIGSGRTHTAMFGWQASLSRTPSGSATDLEDILAFMLSRRDSVPDRVYPGESVGRPIQGRQLYARHCAECHGPDGEGVQAPALNNQEFLNAASNGFLLATMTLGRGGTAMPSWGQGDEKHNALTIEERQDIVAHIRLWQEFVIRQGPAERLSGRKTPRRTLVSSDP